MLNIIKKSMNDLIDIESTIFDNLKIFGGESIESYVDKSKSYFNNISKGIKNIYNPLLIYLCHTKSRLGSCLILLASLERK